MEDLIMCCLVWALAHLREGAMIYEYEAVVER
jgi:hypothetical protein